MTVTANGKPVTDLANQVEKAGGAGTVGPSVQRTTLASDDPAVASLDKLDDWDESDRAKVNPIVGQAGIAANSGAAGDTVPRVILCTDDPAVTALEKIDDWDESDRAKVNPIVGQAGIASNSGAAGDTVPRVILCTDDPAVTSLAVIDDWDGTDGSAAGSDGVKILGIARSSQKAAVANGSAALLVANLYNELVNAGYQWATDSNRTEESDPLNEQATVDSAVNLQAITDGTAAAYAPSVDGIEMFGSSGISWQTYLLGGVGAAATDRTVTVTFEASNDVEVPAGTRIWADISAMAVDLTTGAALALPLTATGGVTAKNTIVDFQGLNVKRVRMKYIFDGLTGSTNGKVVINARRIAIT